MCYNLSAGDSAAAAATFAAIDRDGNGLIDLEEFVQFLTTEGVLGVSTEPGEPEEEGGFFGSLFS